MQTVCTFIVLCAVLAVVGCTAPPISVYEGNKPTLAVQEFFDGRLEAHGVVKNMRGKVIRRFNATIWASWNGEVGTLDETFMFADGDRQKRVWTLTPNEDGSYTGTAGDVVGETRIVTAGNALFLRYRLRLSWDEDTVTVTVDDRMYRVADDIVINESVMTKWGVKVGTVLLTIIRMDEPQD